MECTRKNNANKIVFKNTKFQNFKNQAAEEGAVQGTGMDNKMDLVVDESDSGESEGDIGWMDNEQPE